MVVDDISWWCDYKGGIAKGALTTLLFIYQNRCMRRLLIHNSIMSDSNGDVTDVGFGDNLLAVCYHLRLVNSSCHTFGDNEGSISLLCHPILAADLGEKKEEKLHQYYCSYIFALCSLWKLFAQK